MQRQPPSNHLPRPRPACERQWPAPRSGRCSRCWGPAGCSAGSRCMVKAHGQHVVRPAVCRAPQFRLLLRCWGPAGCPAGCSAGCNGVEGYRAGSRVSCGSSSPALSVGVGASGLFGGANCTGQLTRSPKVLLRRVELEANGVCKLPASGGGARLTGQAKHTVQSGT